MKPTTARSVSSQVKRPRVALGTYDENRAKLSAAKLREYDGQWVAFSADGRRIVAGADDLDALEDRLAALGEDPEKLTFERIEFASTSYLGGAELL